MDPQELNEQLEYLDYLREMGEVNMFGAGPYLMAEFNLDKQEANKVLVHWMRTFGERKGE